MNADICNVFSIFIHLFIFRLENNTYIMPLFLFWPSFSTKLQFCHDCQINTVNCVSGAAVGLYA